MTRHLLDVSALPFTQTYVCRDASRTAINLRDFVASHYDVVQALAAAGLIKANESFGFAMAAPMWGNELEVRQSQGDFWDNPEDFVWFVHGWGPDRNRYIANAVRKMRPLLRPTPVSRTTWTWPFSSTLDIRFNSPTYFRDKIESQNADSTFSWGDFPWGGAVFVRMGELTLAGAISCLTEVEDDLMSRLVLGGFGKRIVAAENLLPDD